MPSLTLTTNIYTIKTPCIEVCSFVTIIHINRGKELYRKFIISIIAVISATGAAMATATINSADRTNLATKAYVDVTRQNLIEELGAPGQPLTIRGEIEDYTGQTEFSADYGVYTGDDYYDENDDSGSLVTTGVVADMVSTLESITISDASFTCSNPPECSLWAKAAANATIPIAESGTFAPLTSSGGSSGQCLANGASCTSDYDCCDRACNSGVCAHGRCFSENATCRVSSQCCNGLICVQRLNSSLGKCMELLIPTSK